MGKNATRAAISTSASVDVVEADPDQDQRRDRHHRRHLQDHGIGIKRALDQPALAEQRWPVRHAGDQRGDESLPGSRSGWRAATAISEAKLSAKRLGDGAGRGQHIGRHLPVPPRSIPRSPASRCRSSERKQNVEERVSCRLHASAAETRALRFGEVAATDGRAARRGKAMSPAMRPGRGRHHQHAVGQIGCFPSRCG